MRSRGRMLELISSVLTQRSRRPPLTTSWSGTFSHLVAGGPPSHSAYKEEVGQNGSRYEVHCYSNSPTVLTLIWSRGRRCQWREALPASSPSPLHHPDVHAAARTSLLSLHHHWTSTTSPPAPRWEPRRTPPPRLTVRYLCISLSLPLVSLSSSCPKFIHLFIPKRIEITHWSTPWMIQSI